MTSAEHAVQTLIDRPDWKAYFEDNDPEELDNIKRELFDLVPKPVSRNDEAAQWRLRCKRQANIDTALLEQGTLAFLSVGGLFNVLTPDGTIERFKREGNWRVSFTTSHLYQRLNNAGRHGFFGTEFVSYKRLENSLRTLGQMVCLAVEDLEEEVLIKAWDTFKIDCINRAFRAGRVEVDSVIQHIKYLGKVAQSVFLKTPTLPKPVWDEEITEKTFLPFVGQLNFLTEFAMAGYRNRKLTTVEARACAQLSNVSRALPYPSSEQVKKSVKDTVDTFMSDFKPHPENLRQYRNGLRSLIGNLPKGHVDQESHVSLVSKGVEENPRSKGGRSHYLVKEARATTDLKFVENIDKIEKLVGKLDCFGQLIVDPYSFAMAKEVLTKHGDKYKRTATLGDILFVEPDEILEHFDRVLNHLRYVPRGLVHILNNTAAKLLLEVGHYTKPYEIICDFICFTKQVKFKLDKTLSVRADVSIEAGMKGRVTTCAKAAFAHLSQIPANSMRGLLSLDPFHRVGFQEADKLWETLKTYQKAFNKKQSQTASSSNEPMPA